MLHAELHAPSVRLLQHGDETCRCVSLLGLMSEASTAIRNDNSLSAGGK
jgi:hypothetical protein